MKTDAPAATPDPTGLAMGLDDYQRAGLGETARHELARGIVVAVAPPSPEHEAAVSRVADLFGRFDADSPGIIKRQAGGRECRIRLPRLVSDRHPDQALYHWPAAQGPLDWSLWTPAIVVEVVSDRTEDRDYVEKRKEYLRAGVFEYWILDPARRRMLALLRAGDVWEELLLDEDGVHRTELLPGLEVAVGELLGPPGRPVHHAGAADRDRSEAEN